MWFLILYFISIGIGVVIGLLRFKQLTTPYKLLSGLLVYTLLSEIVSEYLLKAMTSTLYKNFNFVLYNIVFIAVISIFQYITAQNKHFRQFIILQFIGLLTFIVVNSWQKGFSHFPAAQLIVLSFSLIILSLRRLAELAQNATEIPITDIPDFYVSCAYLIFFFLNVSNWIYKGYFDNPTEQIKLLFEWLFNVVCYIYYLLLAYSIYLNSKTIGRNRHIE